MGGFATPSAPGVLAPGTTDPRVRAFTAAILDPDLVAKYGADAVAQLGYAGLVPPEEDLDRVALFTPPPINWPGQYYQWLDPTTWPDGQLPDGSYRDPTWADVQLAGTRIGRPDLDALAVKSSLAWWRQAYALGPLPEDQQYPDTEGSETWNWPGTASFHGIQTGGNGEPQVVREIYFWGFGKDGKLYQHMQLQKNGWWNTFFIYNKWGQDLTFVKQNGQWIAGWDFGDWFTQNKQIIIADLELATSAILMCLPFANAAAGFIAGTLFGISQFGLSIGVAAAISAAETAQQAFIAGMIAVAKGDLSAAYKYFANMVASLDKVPIPGSPDSIPNQLKEFVASTPVKQLAAVIKETGDGDPSVLVKKAIEMGKAKLVSLAPADLFEARKMIPEQLRPWFDRATKEGASALSRIDVPWYAKGVHDFGTVLGTIANPSTGGVHAPRYMDTGPDIPSNTAFAPAATGSFEQMRAAKASGVSVGGVTAAIGAAGVASVLALKFAPAAVQRKLHMPKLSNKELWIAGGMAGALTLLGLLIRPAKTPSQGGGVSTPPPETPPTPISPSEGSTTFRRF
jgi:hypothetical protein